MAATFRKRGRPRKIDLSEAGIREANRVVQETAFPIEPEPEFVETEQRLGRDAEAKKRVAAAIKEIPQIFEPAQVAWVFDAYVAILCFVYSIILKVEFKLLQDELSFSTEEKETMAVPLAKICSKYAPSSWAGMSSEIQLITSLGIWTVASFQRARNVAAKEAEKQRQENRTRPVDRMHRAGEPLVPV